MKNFIKYLIIKTLYKYIFPKSKIKNWIGIKNENIELPIMIGKSTIIYNNVKIGKYTSIRNNVVIYGNTLGRYCSIVNDVSIGVGNNTINKISTSDCFYYTKWGLTSTDKRRNINNKKTIIGNDVWITTKALILSGVKVANGAIIGSASIVRKYLPDYAIVAGVPAKIIRHRFTKEIIKELLELKWWELDKISNIKDAVLYLKKRRSNANKR